MKWAAWLEWELESNWTDPFLFAIYSIIKPITAALILVFMYTVVVYLQGTGEMAIELFSYLYVGNAFFIFVAQVMWGAFTIIQGDREWYQTIRYLYISPINYYVYMCGRAATKLAIASIAVVVTLLFGTLLLGVKIGLPISDLPLFTAAFLLGLACIVGIGVWLGSITFLTARHVHGLTESVPGIFYLFCGVLYPLGILPGWSHPVGQAIPLTYWFDVMRRFLLPPYSEQLAASTTLSGFSLEMVLAILLVSTILFFMLSIGTFKLTEYLARKAGKIDMLATY